MTRNPSQDTVFGALADTLDAGQRLIADRIELMALDARAAAERGLLTGVWLAVSTLFFTIGWLTSMAALVVLLQPRVNPAASLAVIGAVHVVAGAALVRVFTRRLARGRRPGDEAVQGGASHARL